MTNKNPFTDLLGQRPRDPDLQAGSMGLSAQEVARQYFQSPGQVLALLRTVKNLDIETVAKATRVPADRITAYEASTDEPSPHHIVALAKFYGADLRMLMQLLGAINEEAPAESMGLAAQFDGELTEQEKVDLKEIVAAFGAGRRNKQR